MAAAGKVGPGVEAVVAAVAGVGNRELVDLTLVPGSMIVEHSGKLAPHCKVIVAEGAAPIAGNFHIAYGFAGRGKLTGPGKGDMHHLVAHRAVGFAAD